MSNSPGIFEQKLRDLRGNTMRAPESDTEVLAAAILCANISINALNKQVAQLQGRKCTEDLHTKECLYYSMTNSRQWCLGDRYVE